MLSDSSSWELQEFTSPHTVSHKHTPSALPVCLHCACSETSEHFHRGILNSDPAINQPALAVISEVQMYHVSVQPSNAAVENRELKGVLGFGFFTFSLILFFFSLAPAFISSYLILSSPYGWFCKSGPEVLAAMQPQDP